MYSPKSLKIKNIISHVDSEYVFKNGRAIIVVGLNHDNPSQRGNGSGKSALIESLALAFTGTSIRDVKVKELVNRQAKEGEVELILHNSITKKDMKIWRKVYSGTKSAECRIWLGEDEVRLPDVNTYNKFVFDEIGLSKEDFFNFYLLVQANYSPFLRVGDTKKKEIINRFSGADSVDQLIPMVKTDASAFDSQIEKFKTDIQLEQGKIATYQQRIQEIELKKETWEGEKAQQIEQINGNILNLDDKIIELVDLNWKKIEEAKVVRRGISAANYSDAIQTKQTQVSTLTTQKSTLSQEIATLTLSIPKIKDQQVYKDRIDAIVKREGELKQLIADNKPVITEFEQLKSDIEKSLLDVIQCPNCQHMFSFKNNEFNIAEAESQIPLIEEEIAALNNQNIAYQKEIDETLFTQKQQVNADILAAQKQVQTDITTKNTQISQLTTQITTLNGEISTLQQEERNKQQEVKNLITSIKSNRATIASHYTNIAQYLQNIDQINATDLDQQIKKEKDLEKACEDNITQWNEQLENTIQQQEQIAAWETNFKNFKSFVANQSIKNIEDYTNLFLNQMGSDLAIYLDGFSTLASGKIKEQISVDVLRGGFNEGSYGAFSGGERGRIDICVILAIQQLINLNCASGGLDLLICDEILDQIDTLGLESIINSLQNLDRTIMIVSQNEINALKDHTLLIEKRNKVSKFIE